MKAKIRVGIQGAAGYTGGELLRLLLRHPGVEKIQAQSDSQADRPISSVHGDLVGELDGPFIASIDFETIDLLFLCKGHGASRAFLNEHQLPSRIRIIDLSMDFRWQPGQVGSELGFVYGLPELHKEKLVEAHRVANPGCFATAIQLALLPLAQAGCLKNTHLTGITGSTGAGQQWQDSVHFSWRANNISPYKSLTHQHLGEIKASLGTLQQEVPSLYFIPWRGNFTRGIFVTAVTPYEGDLASAQDLFHQYYRAEPFTHLSEQPIDLKQVVNTNKCLLHLELEAGQLVIHSTLDNLLKGASGQAVQNMNLLFGMEETTGLQLKPQAF